MPRAVKFFFSLHANRGSSRTFDFRAHLDQKVCQVCNLRLARRIFDMRFTFGQRRGHQHVFGSGDGNLVEENVPAAQAASARDARFNVAVRSADFRSHLFERFQVQVYRTRADRTAPGKRYARGARAGDERAERQDRSAHGTDEFVRRFGAIDCLGMDDHGSGRKFGRLHGRAHMREKASHRDDIAHARNIVQFDSTGCQQRRGHCGQRGVLRATDAHGSFEGPSTFNQ